MRATILGAGVLGRALARVLAQRGDEVVVLSPRPVTLPALWVRGDVYTGEGMELATLDSDVIFYAVGIRQPTGLSPKRGIEYAAEVAAHRKARLLLIGPAGHPSDCQVLLRYWAEVEVARRSWTVQTIQLPTLFGDDDHLLSPSIMRARLKKSLIPLKASFRFSPLWIEDALRVILHALETPSLENINLQGPSELTPQEIFKELCSVFSARPSLLLRSPPLEVPVMEWIQIQHRGEDEWKSLPFGKSERLSPFNWLQLVYEQP